MMTLISYIFVFLCLCYLWLRILAKMGFSGLTRWVLLLGCLVPLVGLPLVLLYLGFTEWQVHENLEKFKKGYRR